MKKAAFVLSLLLAVVVLSGPVMAADSGQVFSLEISCDDCGCAAECKCPEDCRCKKDGAGKCTCEACQCGKDCKECKCSKDGPKCKCDKGCTCGNDCKCGQDGKCSKDCKCKGECGCGK